jgi:hypothetical protein
MITKILQDRIDVLKIFIKPTTSNKSQFESNVRNEFMVEYLEGRLNFIQKQKSYIGQNVFKYKKGFSVVKPEDYLKDILNPIEDESFLYTQVDYNNFCELYLQFQIKRLVTDLITNKHYNNSTNPFANLQHQWVTECKQKLIEFFSEIKL